MGLAHLRCGDAAEAVDWLEKVLEPGSDVVLVCEIRARAGLAMAYQDSGKGVKARDTLQLAIERYSEKAPKPGVEDLGSAWCDWLICELLLEEAKGKIDRDGEQNEGAPEREESASDIP